ncbi:MAG: restriction endonuclease subunit S [Bacillota bacterium]
MSGRPTPVQGPWPLPDGWDWYPLGEVCEINPKKPRAMSRADEALTTFVPMSAVDQVTGAIAVRETRPYAELKSKSFTYFEEGDVLFAKITPSMENGKSAVARGLTDGIGLGTTEFHVLRPNTGLVTAEWVHRFIRRRAFRREAAQHFQGAVGQQRVRPDFLKSTLIPVPRSLDRQRGLIQYVDSILADVRRARTIAAGMTRDAQMVMESAMVEVFEGEAVKPGWAVDEVSALCYKPEYGHTASAKREPVGPKFLRITDIQGAKVDWAQVPFCECPRKKVEKFRLVPGDILFARSGATTGKTFLVGDDCPDEAVFASYLIRLRVKGGVSARYLAWFFQSRAYWKQITPRGAAQPNVNAQLLGQVRVPYPTAPADQERIVAHLDALRAEVEGLLQIGSGTVQLLDDTEESAVERAFRGEL